MAGKGSTDLKGMVMGRAFPVVMLLGGVTAAGLVAAMPQTSLDLMTWRLGLPHVLGAATPPIGVTGRTLLAIAALLPFVGACVLAWVWFGRSSPVMRAPRPARTPEAPAVRRADAHPDAPPRRPIRAADDLGPPLPIKTVSVTRGVPEPEQPLPHDLDQPLATFDPIAIPDVPREPVRTVAALIPAPPPEPEPEASEVGFAWGRASEEHAPPLPDAVGEADAVDEPVVREALSADRDAIATGAEEGAEAPPPQGLAPAAEPAGEPTIASLLDRLERSARKKATPVEEPEEPKQPTAESLDDTLVMLRRMAAK